MYPGWEGECEDNKKVPRMGRNLKPQTGVPLIYPARIIALSLSDSPTLISVSFLRLDCKGIKNMVKYLFKAHLEHE